MYVYVFSKSLPSSAENTINRPRQTQSGPAGHSSTLHIDRGVHQPPPYHGMSLALSLSVCLSVCGVIHKRRLQNISQNWPPPHPLLFALAQPLPFPSADICTWTRRILACYHVHVIVTLLLCHGRGGKSHLAHLQSQHSGLPQCWGHGTTGVSYVCSICTVADAGCCETPFPLSAFVRIRLGPSPSVWTSFTDDPTVTRALYSLHVDLDVYDGFLLTMVSLILSVIESVCLSVCLGHSGTLYIDQWIH